MSALLFDRDQVDRIDDLPESPERLDGSKLLWVDIDRPSAERAAEIAEAFQLDDATRAELASPLDRASFVTAGDTFR